MASEAKKNPLDALSLLVDAANAQSSAPQKKSDAEVLAEAPQSAPGASGINGAKVAANIAAVAAQQRTAEMELREALHRQAMEREALEGEAMLQQRAALMSAGLGGLGGGGLNFQETEYMQQLRLEALVQQRRQETLAQLALAQEYNPEAQALIAAQLRQAAMMREQELLMASGGVAAHMDPMAAALRQREGARNENALLRLFEERDRQHKLAALSATAPSAVPSMDTAPPQPPAVAAVASPVVNPPTTTKSKEETVQALAGSKVTVLPCRARGMPMDHNAKTAYFVVPEDVKHGAELVCSYDHCRNAGIKFRYCVFCSLPVAKRNFFKKHKHEGKIPPERLAAGITKEEEILPSDGKQADGQKRPLVRQWNTQEVLVKAMASTSGLGKKPNAAQMIKRTYSSGEMAQMVEQRKRKWEKLLDTRPLSQSETEMILWVRKVLDVSDLTPPLSEAVNTTAVKQIKGEESEKSETEAPPEKEGEEEVPPTKEESEEEESKAMETNSTPDETPKEEEKAVVEDDKAADKAPVEEDNKASDKLAEDDKASGADSSEDDEEANSGKDDDDDEEDEMEEDAPAADEKDGNLSDGSASSSGSSVDLRAHKRARKE